MSDFMKSITVLAHATDPVYIGTGGYTIGRVDNTIVRDPITRIPKIPGTSLCGTWRYFMMLQLQGYFQENDTIHYRSERSSRKDIKIEDLFESDAPGWAKTFEGNRYAAVRCAGQDEFPQEDTGGEKGHCGKCIVCQTFGFSKKDKSFQGLASFTDLNILFFPVYTRLGTRWITSEQILMDSNLIERKTENLTGAKIAVSDQGSREDSHSLNLGWLNLETQKKQTALNVTNCDNLNEKEIIIVPDSLISQIINSNLEVRTSVSIDPITGAAKEGALFTSEAIPLTTWFYGNVYLFDRPEVEKVPETQWILEALNASKQYYETLGIGGMTTRGFGRLKINSL